MIDQSKRELQKYVKKVCTPKFEQYKMQRHQCLKIEECVLYQINLITTFRDFKTVKQLNSEINFIASFYFSEYKRLLN